MMEMNQMRELLCVLLECGYLDLNILDGNEYPMEDVIALIKDEFQLEVDINTLAYGIIVLGKRDIEDIVNQRIKELEENVSYFDDLNTEEEDKEILLKWNIEIQDLSSLDVHEDVQSYHNYLDTNVCILPEIEPIYRQYESTKKAIEHFENMTGFTLN